MNLQHHYDNLWQETLVKFKQDEFDLDHHIDTPDLRRGITLLLRPDEETKQRVQQLQNKLREIEPNQYYYPLSDIHVTLLSVISCYKGFSLDEVQVKEYVKLIKPCFNEVEPFQISFEGLTASPSCVLLQGFVNDNTINKLRDRLRERFHYSQLQSSMDKRYTIETAHATIVRFKQPVLNNEQLINTILKHRNTEFGQFTVDSVELVYNDWYQREQNTERLHDFRLS